MKIFNSLLFEDAVLKFCLPAFNRTWQKEGWIKKNKGQKGRQKVTAATVFARRNFSGSFLHFCGHFKRDWMVVFKSDEGFSRYYCSRSYEEKLMIFIWG